MKTITALTTAAAALTTSLVAGAVFFGPSASTASFAPDTKPGQVAVEVRDDEGDGIGNVKVLVTDVSNPTARPPSTTSGSNGHLEVSFPGPGTYLIHIDTPPDPMKYADGHDADDGAGTACLGKVQSRCITVQVTNGVVHLPGQVGVQATDLYMEFIDRSPEPRVEVFVQLQGSATTLISGGSIVVTPVADDPKTTDDDQFTMEGTGQTLSKKIPSATYEVTLTAPKGYTILSSSKTQVRLVPRRTPFIFVVTPATVSGAENTSVHVETDERNDTAGTEVDDVLDSVFGDGTGAGKDPVDDFSTETPAPAPNDTPRTDPPAAVETVPVETSPSKPSPSKPSPSKPSPSRRRRRPRSRATPVSSVSVSPCWRPTRRSPRSSPACSQRANPLQARR